MPPADTKPKADLGEKQKLDVVQEELEVGKRSVKQGGVRYTGPERRVNATPSYAGQERRMAAM